jgi:two-component system copper resistance phosphate regulon response regulator CusR
VLVVEDERKIAEAVSAGLRGFGYEVLLSASGEDAFFVLHSHALT